MKGNLGRRRSCSKSVLWAVQWLMVIDGAFQFTYPEPNCEFMERKREELLSKVKNKRPVCGLQQHLHHPPPTSSSQYYYYYSPVCPYNNKREREQEPAPWTSILEQLNRYRYKPSISFIFLPSGELLIRKETPRLVKLTSTWVRPDLTIPFPVCCVSILRNHRQLVEFPAFQSKNAQHTQNQLALLSQE